MVELKCTKCGVVQPEDDFYRRGERRMAECKACHKARPRNLTEDARKAAIARTKAWRAANQDRYLAARKERYWADPEANKAASRQYRTANIAARRAAEAAYKESHRDAISARTAARYQASEQLRERAQERTTAWRLANPGRYLANQTIKRMRYLGVTATVEVVEPVDVFGRTAGHCGICGNPVGARYEIDHIVPLSRGGPHVASNLQIAHRSCNARKATKESLAHP